MIEKRAGLIDHHGNRFTRGNRLVENHQVSFLPNNEINSPHFILASYSPLSQRYACCVTEIWYIPYAVWKMGNWHLVHYPIKIKPRKCLWHCSISSRECRSHDICMDDLSLIDRGCAPRIQLNISCHSPGEWHDIFSCIRATFTWIYANMSDVNNKRQNIHRNTRLPVRCNDLMWVEFFILSVWCS